VTDADLLLGYLSADSFLGGEMKLDVANASRAMARLAEKLVVSNTEAAWGICNMVNENMASAARIHIAEKGHDPRDFSMIATGGAGPVHALEVARKLRIPRVLVPIAAGAGSCLGMLAAPARVDRSWANPALLADTPWPQVAAALEQMKAEAQSELDSAGATEVEWRIGLEMRYHGQGAEVPISVPYEKVSQRLEAKVAADFEAQYSRLYGRTVPGGKPQVMTWRLTGRAVARGHHFEWGDGRVRSQGAQRGTRPIYLPLRKAYGEVPVYDRYSLTPGQQLQGPLILEERESTIVVPVRSEVAILADRTVSVQIKEFDE
jgi:N-methylhydantoinase A